jgi:hypothetical protein
MRPKKYILTLIVPALLVLAGAGTASAHSRGHHGHHRHGASLHAAHKATEKFRKLAVAEHNGYAILKDAAGIACIDNPGVGGMGVHYVNGDLVGDGAVKATTPEALVYEPRPNGRLRLVALEYVVFQADWDAHHAKLPRLFGEDFELVGEGNRYGLPAFYELHAWVFKHNPRGMFDDWNPRVTCPS